MLPTETFEPPRWLELVVEDALCTTGMNVWVPTGSMANSAMVRVPRFPRDIPSSDLDSCFELDTVRNCVRSCQIAVASDDAVESLRCNVSQFQSPRGSTIESDAFDIRFVGYVPIKRAFSEPEGVERIEDIGGRGISGDRAPDVVGDPLISVTEIDLPAYRTQPIWLTVNIPDVVPPGTYRGKFEITAADRDAVTIPVQLRVADIRAPSPENYTFDLDVWLHPDAIADAGGIERWSEEHWERLRPYFQELALAGQRAVAASIIHQPWRREWPGGKHRPQTQAGFDSLVDWTYNGNWEFEYSKFDTLVQTALANGVGPHISAYSMLAFREPQRLTYHDEHDELVSDPVEVGSRRWREAWTAFLTDFSKHLEKQGWLECTWLAFDERPPELIEPAVDLIEEVAPEFSDRIHVAGSIDVEHFADDFSTNVSNLSDEPCTIDSRIESDAHTTLYTSVSTLRPNTFTISPLIEARQLPWVVADTGLDGYLRWAFNSWPRNVFQDPVFRFMQGDEYLIYPGDPEPISSVRWEQLKAGIRDYELWSRLKKTKPARADDAAARAAKLYDSETDAIANVQASRSAVLAELSSG